MMTTRALDACGFSPHEADHLVTLKLQYERGAFRELTEAQKRLLFVRWLVEQERLSDGQPIAPISGVDEDRGLAALKAEAERRAAGSRSLWTGRDGIEPAFERMGEDDAA